MHLMLEALFESNSNINLNYRHVLQAPARNLPRAHQGPQAAGVRSLRVPPHKERLQGK